MNRAKVLRMLSQSVAPTEKDNNESLTPESIPPVANTCNITRQELPSQLETIQELDLFDENGYLEQQKGPKFELNEMELLDNWDPMGEDFKSPLNTLTIDPDKEPESVITGKMSDECIMIGKHRVCEFFLKNGHCADGRYCSRLHIDPASRYKIDTLKREYEMNTGRTRMTSKHLSPVRLQPNSTALLLASVTMAHCPTNFYFVTPYDGVNFAAFNKKEVDFYIDHVQKSSSLKTKLQKCHEHLARLFDHNFRVDSVQSPLGIGQMVACKLENGRFCRATILDNRDWDDSECYYKLFLIDRGTQVRLPRESIYEIRASCLSEPPMALLGRLELKPAGGALKWSPKALSFFEEFVARSKYMLCNIKSFWEQEGLFTVDLFDIETRTSITDLMIAEGMADQMIL